MKKLLFLTALLASFILVSCSDTVTDPVNTKVNKTSGGSFPFEYLQGFEEVKVLAGNQPGIIDRQEITFQINRNIEDIKDIFVVVTYGDPVVDSKGEPVLYFINQPGQKTLKLRLDAGRTVQSIRAFVPDNVSETELTTAYEDGHRFRGVSSTWQIMDNQLIIQALPWTPDVIEVYALIQKPGADKLVYLQRPANSSKIIIPNYTKGEAQEVQLFVNSNPLIDTH